MAGGAGGSHSERPGTEWECYIVVAQLSLPSCVPKLLIYLSTEK